jgi:glycerol uptake facilitator protein
MADREPEPTRPGAEPVGRDVEAARPVGEVPGRRPRQMETFRTGVLGDLGAEFLGTFVLIAFGDGVVAMAVAALNQSGRGTKVFDASGDWLLITFGWAMAVVFGVYVAGGITGAHINPAVTLAFAVRGDLPWRKVPGYWLAQVVGAFLGAALVLLVYHDSISSYEAANKLPHAATSGIFFTHAAPYFNGSLVGPLITEIVGTAFLLMFVCALVDRRNLAPKANLTPFLVGLAVLSIGNSYGANSGYAINPARDFGPRLLAFFAGYGDAAFPDRNWYFIVPIIGPLIGGVIGVYVYDFFIKNVLVARGVPEAEA